MIVNIQSRYETEIFSYCYYSQSTYNITRLLTLGCTPFLAIHRYTPESDLDNWFNTRFDPWYSSSKIEIRVWYQTCIFCILFCVKLLRDHFEYIQLVSLLNTFSTTWFRKQFSSVDVKAVTTSAEKDFSNHSFHSNTIYSFLG